MRGSWVNGKNGHERFGLEMGMGGGEGEGKLGNGEWGVERKGVG